MTFKSYLVGGIGVVIAVMLFGAGSSITLYAEGRDAARRTSELLVEMETIQEISLDAERMVATVRGYLLTGDARERTALDRVVVRLQDKLGGLSARYPSEAPFVVLVSTAVTSYHHDAVAAARRARSAPRSPEELEGIYEEFLQPSRTMLRGRVTALESTTSHRIIDVATRTESRALGVGLIVLVSCLIATTIGITLAFIVSRRLSGAYSRGQQATADAARAATSRKELLDMVSHDLRSPLSTMLLGIDAIRTEHGELRHLQRMEHAAHRMQRLVEDLLDASRAETTGIELDRRRWRVDELFDVLRALFSSRAERTGVRLVLAPTDLEVFADRDRVLQVLSNLIGNALSFTRQDGEVEVTATRVDDRVHFAVRDTGPGLSDREQVGLFDAFQQGETDHDRHGLRGSVGLGLYIAKNLVQAHAGTIGVDSRLGHGATFWFELPQTDAQHAASAPN